MRLRALLPRIGSISSVLALLCSLSARAEERPLPPQLAPLAKVVKLYDEDYIYPGYIHFDWSETEFGPSGKKRGSYWKLAGTVDGSDGAESRWAAVKAAFLSSGWTVVAETPSGGILRRTVGAAESWARVATSEDVSLESIDVGPNPLVLHLKPPAKSPEQLQPDHGDFPFLMPPPGAVFKGGRVDPVPFAVKLEGAPPEIIAATTLQRDYDRPRNLSNLEFALGYQDALTQAGWEIISVFNSADVGIDARYTKQGRNVWARLHQNNQTITFNVADGAADLKATLAKECHIALYGVLFDFNKSTLKPASDPMLARVQALLEKNPGLQVEVQGHTDNVGDDAYNQKLSEARAGAVVTWLTGHGIASKRLSSKGYGRSRPVADNGSDEGRARNRRVEIADPSCKPGA